MPVQLRLITIAMSSLIVSSGVAPDAGSLTVGFWWGLGSWNPRSNALPYDHLAARSAPRQDAFIGCLVDQICSTSTNSYDYQAEIPGRMHVTE
jgi:hypothetical protein